MRIRSLTTPPPSCGRAVAAGTSHARGHTLHRALGEDLRKLGVEEFAEKILFRHRPKVRALEATKQEASCLCTPSSQRLQVVGSTGHSVFGNDDGVAGCDNGVRRSHGHRRTHALTSLAIVQVPPDAIGHVLA